MQRILPRPATSVRPFSRGGRHLEGVQHSRTGLLRRGPRQNRREGERRREVERWRASGAHRAVATPFPKWVPADVLADGKKLSVKDALASLAPCVP